MRAQEAIRINIDSALFVLKSYLSDFSDSDLLVRPAQGTNHVAWQLGHLICSEFNMMEAIRPGHSPKLPTGFVEAHSKEMASSEDKSKFLTKKEYLEIYDKQHRATLEILEMLSDTDLEKESPENLRSFAPNYASVLSMQGSHPMMHIGQIVVLRRKLGKPILM